MNNFINAAKRPVESIETFLRDAADNTIKYKPEAGKKHWVYFPYQMGTNENGETVKEPIAIMGRVHELRPEPNKYEACICLDGIVIDGENDGTCPFCDRVNDSFSIYRYKMDKAVEKAEKRNMVGDELDEYKKNSSRKFMEETPVSKAKPYLYMLIVQFKMDAQQRGLETGPDGLPVFELKVMKLSDKGIAKIRETFINSNIEFEGSEAIFKYDNKENAMLVAGSRVVSPVFQGRALDSYKGLREAIEAAVAKWDWEGIQAAFPEWKGCTVEQAKAKCDKIFHAWDAYQANPAVGFLEDKDEKTTNPALPGVNTPTETSTPVGDTTPKMGFGNAGFGSVDPNAAFGNMPNL